MFSKLMCLSLPEKHRQFTSGVVREGVIAENVLQFSAKFTQLSAEFPHSFPTQSKFFVGLSELSAEFLQKNLR